MPRAKSPFPPARPTVNGGSAPAFPNPPNSTPPSWIASPRKAFPPAMRTPGSATPSAPRRRMTPPTQPNLRRFRSAWRLGASWPALPMQVPTSARSRACGATSSNLDAAHRHSTRIHLGCERTRYHSRHTSASSQDCFGGIRAAVLRAPPVFGVDQLGWEVRGIRRAGRAWRPQPNGIPDSRATATGKEKAPHSCDTRSLLRPPQSGEKAPPRAGIIRRIKRRKPPTRSGRMQKTTPRTVEGFDGPNRFDSEGPACLDSLSSEFPTSIGRCIANPSWHCVGSTPVLAIVDRVSPHLLPWRPLLCVDVEIGGHRERRHFRYPDTEHTGDRRVF